MRLLGIIARPIDLDGNQMVIGTSIGIAVTEAGASDPTRLLQEADLALYQAKAEGRSGYRFFEAAMNERLQARRALEADLRQALAGGQFRMLYQPQVELGEDGDTPRVVGAEALIRWDHPTRGELSPDRFMPLTEENGLILPIGEWVLNEACAEAMTWPAPLRVAVNVSPMQFAHSGFVAAVERALAATGLPAERLELEVTEGILLSETDETVATLTRLRAMGVKLAMDDFGTGYSSLGYLRKFRFDKIKIDRSFVSHIGSDAEAAAIVRAIVRITHALGMRANAEGVETEEQVGMLRAEGCGEVQGFLFGRPMSAKSFAALIAEPSQPSLQRQAA
jgi:EAL domain-containing protein (putative c-di-GMP-specific phosphodiesterase class I)